VATLLLAAVRARLRAAAAGGLPSGGEPQGMQTSLRLARRQQQRQRRAARRGCRMGTGRQGSQALARLPEPLLPRSTCNFSSAVMQRRRGLGWAAI
jgi:hypothetical protein